MSSLTTRNQLRGKVTAVTTGSVMAEVRVETSAGEIVAVITKHSAERLGLKDGDQVTALVKATEVMLSKGSEIHETLSTRNQLPGKIVDLQKGAVMAEVVIDVGGDEVVAAITEHSVERLALAVADDVVVLIKSTEVMLAK